MDFVEYYVEFDEDKAEDVTELMKSKCAEKYKYSIKKVLKYGHLYKIFFCFGYTAFGEETRYARRIGEVKWYSKIATEEREYNYSLEYYIEDFKRNRIYFDGKNIPIFIDKIEDVMAQATKDKK